MIYNYFSPLFYPRFNTLNEKPPTIYAILNSIVNFGKDEEERIKIPELSRYGRTTIFDFSYPLSKNVNKEDFECMILNHYFMRRINFDTVTAFKLQLNVRLNSIMPLYNKLFDSLENWDIFSGEEITRILEDEKTSSNITDNITNNTSDNTTNNSLENNSSTNSSNTLDSRNSDMPQSQIENVQNADYLTNYKLDKNTANSTDSSTSNGNSTSKTTNNTTENSTSSANENTNTKEIINRSLADKMTIYKDFQENLKSIYDLIFKELDCLFYSLV